jgi:hypothetical protein
MPLSRDATTARVRARAMGFAVGCLTSLGRRAEVASWLGRLRRELPGLEGKEREYWEWWVNRVQRADEKGR